MTFTDFVDVIPGLYIGSHPEPDDPFELGANVVVSLTSDTTARSVPRNGLLIHWPIKDGPIPPVETLDAIASFIVTRLEVGSVVYVHCRAGMNRSALVVARVLMERGVSAREAIDLVRARRQGSLSDEYADWLLAHPIEASPDAERLFVSDQLGSSTYPDGRLP
jgi:protein-tyrosine phosphatase